MRLSGSATTTRISGNLKARPAFFHKIRLTRKFRNAYLFTNRSCRMTGRADRVMEFMDQIAGSIGNTSGSLDRKQVSVFLSRLLKARRIYVTGAGRSGLIARAFAMRLMHLGRVVYVIGETVTPALASGDLLVIFSGSGETQTMVSFCTAAQDRGGIVLLITGSPHSHIGRLADHVVDLGDPTGYYVTESGSFERRQMTGEYRSVSAFAPLGTMFETMALIFTDAVISAMIEEKHDGPDELKGRVWTDQAGQRFES